MIKSNKVIAADNAEFGVDSRYRSGKERIDEGKALMEARLERIKDLSDEEIIEARKLQLMLRKNCF